MTTINGRACVANGRNLYLYPKAIRDDILTYSSPTATLEPFDSTTNMWHIVAKQGSGSNVGIYLPSYADDKMPNNSDWSYSADIKGTGKITVFGIEASSHNPVVGTIGTEWSRISQTGRTYTNTIKTIIMYFDTTSSPLDVYIKLPKLEIGKVATPLTPAPVDKVFSDSKQVYGRNLWQQLDSVSGYFGKSTTDGEANIYTAASPHRTMKTLVAVTAGEKLIASIYNPNKVVNMESSNRWGFYDASGNLLLPLIQIDWLTGEPIQRFMVTVPSNAASVRLAFIQGPATGIIDESIEIKVERGNTPTDWTPAPEDVM